MHNYIERESENDEQADARASALDNLFSLIPLCINCPSSFPSLAGVSPSTTDLLEESN